MIKSFFRTITKPKFVITLIVLIFIAALLGVLIPQVGDKSPSYFEEWRLKSPKTFYIVSLLQFNRVYTSLWFLSLVFIIMLSLGYSLYSQIKRNIKVHGSRFTVHSKEEVHGNDEQIVKFMRKKGYRLVHSSQNNPPSPPFTKGGTGGITDEPDNGEPETVNGERVMVFSKNSVNRWGGVIFHSGLFLIIIAALIGLAFQKRGFVQVMEGEVFSGMHDDFLVREMGVFQNRFDTGFETMLSMFDHKYWDTGQVKELSSTVVIIDKNGRRQERAITVNNPLKHKGINIYQSSDYGYALTFVLKRPDGSEAGTHFLLDRPDRRTKPFVGKIDFPQTPYIFEMKFYPDISMNSFHLGKPISYLQVLKGRDNQVFEGLVIPGNVMNIEGNLVRFQSISHWSGLIFTKDTGTVIAYAGFIIAVTGIIIIYMLPYKEIGLTRVGDTITSMYGTTKRYHAIFEEEMNNIKAEMRVKADG